MEHSFWLRSRGTQGQVGITFQDNQLRWYLVLTFIYLPKECFLYWSAFFDFHVLRLVQKVPYHWAWKSSIKMHDGTSVNILCSILWLHHLISIGLWSESVCMCTKHTTHASQNHVISMLEGTLKRLVVPKALPSDNTLHTISNPSWHLILAEGCPGIRTYFLPLQISFLPVAVVKDFFVFILVDFIFPQNPPWGPN